MSDTRRCISSVMASSLQMKLRTRCRSSISARSIVLLQLVSQYKYYRSLKLSCT
ncbi:hypothetical protein [Achromobacter phage kuwaak_TL2]|nr:hypothetical protein [Achromobacter phage kuwaak_TL2]WNO49035.1 hypothetical protein [Achromobacter phage emuu_LB7]